MRFENKITARQLGCICMLVCLGGLFVIGGTKEGGHESYISVLLSLIIVVPALAMYISLIKYQGEGGIFALAESVLGKAAGKTLTLLLLVYSFVLMTALISNFANFIRLVMLPDVPEVFIGSVVMACAVLLVSKKAGVIGMVSSTVAMTVIGLLIITFTLSLLNIPKSNSLLPFLYNGYAPVALGGLDVFATSFGDLVLILPLAAKLKSGENAKKTIIGATAIAWAVLLAVFVRNVLLLGEKCYEIMYFKSYSAVSVMNFGKIFQRMEVLVSAIYIITDFVKIGVCLYFASEGIKSLFSLDQPPVIIPVAFAVVFASQWWFENEQELMEFKVIYKYFGAAVQLIIPLAILIAAIIKGRRGGALRPIIVGQTVGMRSSE